MDGVDQDGAVRRIGLSVGRRVWEVLGQQASGRVDRSLDILRGGIDVAREIELQGDRQRTYTARRSHLAQSRDRRKLLLERCCDRRCHRFRAGAGIIDRNHDGRKIDVRQRRYRQQSVSADTENEHTQHHQRGRDRPSNKRLRDTHRRSPCCLSEIGRLNDGFDSRGGCHPAAPAGVEGACGLTRAPLVSRYWPSTTTRSPGVRPFVTTAMPSWIEATSTARRSTVLSGLIT